MLKMSGRATMTGAPTEAAVHEVGGRPTVGVIIPAFNQARFLAEAINSVLAQTSAVDEIIVVDDGSTDDPAAVVNQFPNVRLIRRRNGGPSAARNTGVLSCMTSHVLFFDADDRLLPIAIQAGLACIADQPDCAFVYGRHRLISEDGRSIDPDRNDPIEGDARLAFLAGDPIAIHAALFRRDCLLAVNGFDETLRMCEDYDLCLRLAHKYQIARHPTIVAEYRRHDLNATNDYAGMLKARLRLIDLYEARITTDTLGRRALRDCRIRKHRYYVGKMLHAASVRWRARHNIGILVKDSIQIVRLSPHLFMRVLPGFIGRRASKVLPRTVVQMMDRIRGRPIRSRSDRSISEISGDWRRSVPTSAGTGVRRSTAITSKTFSLETRVTSADASSR